MLREWFDAEGVFNAARWVLLSEWRLSTLVLVGLAAAAGLGLSWWNARTLKRRRRGVLLALRLGTVLLLLGLFLQPGVRLENVTRVRNHVALLVDTSRSMALPGEGGRTRLASAQAMLADEADTLAKWREVHQVDVFSTADQARPAGSIAGLEAIGDATRLLSGLGDVAARFQPEDLAAVIVISDGADNGALGMAARQAEGEIPAAVSAITGRLGVPVHTVFTGPEAPPRDVAIVDVAYDDFAFVRNVVSIETDIRVTGYNDLLLPVTLRRGETILGQRMLQTEAGHGEYHFEFEFVPDKTGKAVFTLEVGAGPDEQIRVNNRRQFVVRIIRDKIRVLQVVGRPSWDQRFLRKLLKKNPNVDLISFFILRTSDSLEMASRDELSLIPFPTQELFEDQLGSFDLIVFQNFKYGDYNMRQYLPLIRDYVRAGGGFVMTGGDQSFASGDYQRTPIAEFLPVDLPQGGGELVRPGRFTTQITREGARHPITALSLVPEENERIWRGLPPLSGTNRIAGVADHGAVLVEAADRTLDGAPEPVVVVGEWGEGRVLSVSTDSTWHWGFLAAGEGGDSRHYYKFWGNAMRWLIQDPALKPMRVEADRDRYPLGAEATLLSRVFGRGYQPEVDLEVTLTVDREWYDDLGQPQRDTVAKLQGRTDEHGEWAARFKPAADGAYFVSASADLPGGLTLSDTDVFVVTPDPVELRTTEAQPGPLELLARAGGGEARTLSEGLAGLETVAPRVVKVNRRKDIPLWSSGWLLLLAILLPSMEWFYRRRWGLL